MIRAEEGLVRLAALIDEAIRTDKSNDLDPARELIADFPISVPRTGRSRCCDVTDPSRPKFQEEHSREASPFYWPLIVLPKTLLL